MLRIHITYSDGRQETVVHDKISLMIGRASGNDICLDLPGVSRFHARISVEGEKVIVQDLDSTNGTFVNSDKVVSRELQSTDKLVIGKTVLNVEAPAGEKPAEAAPVLDAAPVVDAARVVDAAPVVDAARAPKAKAEPVVSAKAAPEATPAAEAKSADVQASAEKAVEKAPEKTIEKPAQKQEVKSAKTPEPAPAEAKAPEAPRHPEPKIVPLSVEAETPSAINLSALDAVEPIRSMRDSSIGLPSFSVQLPADEEIFSHFGASASLFSGADVDRIVFVGKGIAHIETSSGVQRTDKALSCDDVAALAGKLKALAGGEVTLRGGCSRHQLQSGATVTVLSGPLVHGSPVIIVKKPFSGDQTLAGLVQAGWLSESMSAFLASAVAQGHAILVSGDASASKSAVLQALCHALPADERVAYIDSAPELTMPAGSISLLTSHNAGLTAADVLDAALSISPGRVIVGELGDLNARDMLYGLLASDASLLATISGHSPRQALTRLEAFVSARAAGAPIVSIREHIALGIHFIVQLGLAGQKRVVTRISEVMPLGERPTFEVRDVFRYREGQGDTPFEATGHRPDALDDVGTNGSSEPVAAFSVGHSGPSGR